MITLHVADRGLLRVRTETRPSCRFMSVVVAYLQVTQVAHHLRKVGVALLHINGRCELSEAHTGRVLALPPGRLAVYGHESVAAARTA